MNSQHSVLCPQARKSRPPPRPTCCQQTEPSNPFAAGLQTIKSSYEIHAMHMKLKYFVEHTYDPAARCMTFKLDYNKRSDLDDSVGYWFVEPTGRAACRVYYSCECQLRGWVVSAARFEPTAFRSGVGCAAASPELGAEGWAFE